uniref:AMP nucleosidase n=1 Tax=Chlamydomonas leiostraca TaxID=1034604 RepID=A0A7S0WJ99_9CHLO|mmetsp:Transcript_15620/g.38878  ORF Transcript_15620/g.38878 Transcript_15620/m.38878 type:complete len:561 (+) Transcript_15620:208-1890(+)
MGDEHGARRSPFHTQAQRAKTPPAVDVANGPVEKKQRINDDLGGAMLLHSPSFRHKHVHYKLPEEWLTHLATKYKISKAKVFTNGQEAMDYAELLYSQSCDVIRDCLRRFAGGEPTVYEATRTACYPMVACYVDIRDMDRCRGHYAAYGVVKEPGYYTNTLTRPDVMGDYYAQQLSILVERYQICLVVGASDAQIPLPFVMDTASAPHDISSRRAFELHENFCFPDLSKINDDLPNGCSQVPPNSPKPLCLFSAERTDLGLQRLAHYCGTHPKYFQGFVLLTNYQRYVEEFIAWGQATVLSHGSGYTKLVGPRDTVLADAAVGQVLSPDNITSLPQMPAYHVVRKDGLGITLVNIGVGPSNAKTLTDHLAVLRPHCWLMLGHCAGLRVSQNLGDYVLAHAYVREDHVMDQDLPLWIPLPPIAEVQTALEAAVGTVLRDVDIKSAMRTGTLVTTDNRDWELRAEELKQRFIQSRAIAVDMESATIAANGFRFRVPYGTLLCVSDKPIHGELKLQGMANEFYRQRTNEHLQIGLEAVRLLREQGVGRLQSRKLRGFDEPPFR